MYVIAVSAQPVKKTSSGLSVVGPVLPHRVRLEWWSTWNSGLRKQHCLRLQGCWLRRGLPNPGPHPFHLPSSSIIFYSIRLHFPSPIYSISVQFISSSPFLVFGGPCRALSCRVVSCLIRVPGSVSFAKVVAVLLAGLAPTDAGETDNRFRYLCVRTRTNRCR